VDVTQPTTTLLRLKREAAAGQLKQNEAGQTQVRLKLEDGSDYPHRGTMEFSEVTVDLTTGSVTLRALVPNPERLLLPGMFVRELIEEGVRQGAVLAPQQGVSHDQKGQPTALVVGPNDLVELRMLQTDRAIGDQWLVTSGLNPGDRVIVEGIQFAKPGSKVVPEEYRAVSEEKKAARQTAAAGTAGVTD
jgi:membrane fusion protein (multidrug efflux system)